MADFKDITMLELNNFSGSICLYSLDFEKSLGDNINASYSKLFQNNIITYNNSLASESKEDLIIIDGDEFNPSKIFGLTKKYEEPIVIFISNNDKINKLKGLLLREILIINKNTLSKLEISSNVKENLEAKRLKDIEKGIIVDNPIDITSLDVPIDENIPEGATIILDSGEEATVLSSGFTEEQKKLLEETDIFKDDISSFAQKSSDKIIIKEIKEEKISKLEPVSVQKITKEDKILQNFNRRFTNKSLTINNFGVFGLSIDVSKKFKEIFPNVISLRTNGSEVYDVYILDISFATERVFNLIERIMPKPLIIMSSFEAKLQEIKYLNLSNILIIPKPLSYSQEELEDKIYDYLNNYNVNKEVEKINQFKNSFIPKGLKDDNEKSSIREKYNNKTNKTSGISEENMKETKEEINRTNKRKDKDISLDEIYEKLGLNSLAVYESLVNKEVYSTYDGKVVKYKPDGYLIEIRLERLKSKGLSEKEISSAMQRMEEADIRFERKQLMRIEKYKLRQLKKQNM